VTGPPDNRRVAYCGTNVTSKGRNADMVEMITIVV